MVLVSALIFLLGMAFVNAQPEYIVVNEEASDLSTSAKATYECIFQNLWTRQRHPIDFPKSAHWSAPVVPTHNKRYQMFKAGSRASNGVEQVAEVGSWVVML